MLRKADRKGSEVKLINQIFHLRIGSGELTPIIKDGKPLRDLGAGWNFHSINLTFAPMLLFELERQDGQRATWYFDSSYTYIGNAVAGLPAARKDLLIAAASSLIRDILYPIIGITENVAQKSYSRGDSFFDISRDARLDICDKCMPIACSTEITMLNDLPEVFPSRTTISGRNCSISRCHLSDTLTDNFQLRLTYALKDGYLSWLNPVDGKYIASSGGLLLSDFEQLYKFEDPDSGFVFFLVVTRHVAGCFGVYFPSENMLIAKDDYQRYALLAQFTDILPKIIRYSCLFGDTLIPYLRRGAKRVCAFTRDQHIGHQLWNELSGLNKIIETVDPKYLPDIVVNGGLSSQFFGPLGEIFPELSGKTGSDLKTLPDVVLDSHRRDLCLVRFNDEFVSKGLRERIVRHVKDSFEYSEVSKQISRKGGLVVVIGLRIENRTVVDLEGFICRLIDRIAMIAPNAHIILDGQNCREGVGRRPLGSAFDSIAKRPLLKFELRLCRRIIKTCRYKAISVSVTTGLTVKQSLAFIDFAHCVITIWGAGLAKYRWVMNKPTLALSSRINLLHRHDLLIYCSEKYMDEPSRMDFADADVVTDDPDGLQLVPVRDPLYVSFHVDETKFFSHVESFVKAFIP